MGDLSGTKQRRLWLMSQSYLGWPSNRPRLYTVLVKKDSGALADPGLAAIDKLYRIPNMSVLAHMVADRDFRSVSTLSVRCLIDSEFVCSTVLYWTYWTGLYQNIQTALAIITH